MNIGIVTTWYPAGAGYVSKTYERSLERDYGVFIYARGGKTCKGNPDWDRVNVTWAPRHPRSTGIWSGHFRRWLKKYKIQLLLFNEQRFWRPVLEAKKMGVICGAYVDYYTQLTVKAFSIYDFLVCNTRRHYSVFSWHPSCFYVPWGTDVEKYKPETAPQLRPLTFITSAGWQGTSDADRRGTLLALASFANVRGNCFFKVYSQVPFLRMTPQWQTLIKADSRVRLIEGTFDPFPFSAGDVYVYPSRLDGIGLSLPEALASGLAAITTDAAPMNEFVMEGENGFLVDVDQHLGRHDGYYWAESICNRKSLVEKMQTYVDHPEVCRRHQRNARVMACERLNAAKNFADFPSMLANVCFHAPKKEDRLRVASIDGSIWQALYAIMRQYGL